MSRYLIDGLSGVNSLSSGYFLGESLPNSVISCLPETVRSSLNQGAFFSIVPFINGKKGVPSKGQLEDLFIVTCFLSYFDAIDENTITDNKGKAHIIDTGSGLLYRGMGLKKEISKNWHPYYISEFRTMFDFPNIYTKAGLKSLDDISAHKKANQLKNILDKGQMILEKADAFLRKTHASERISILEMISNRLYQMEIFYNHLTSQWNRTSRKYIQASDLDAAGFLSVAEYQGEKLILLGKRSTSNGTNTWCNLGGMANIGEFLHETAAREVFEESSGLIIVKSAASMPSHDLVNEKSTGIYYRYRNYFHETSWFDPSLIRNEEYSTYAWFPIKDILNPNIATDKKYKLFEPFKNSLMQPEIRDWLESYINQKPVQETHTQGMITNSPLKNTQSRYDFINPSEHMAECAHEFIKSKAIKENTYNKNAVVGKSISEIFLLELAKENGIADSENLSISELLDKLYVIRNKKDSRNIIDFPRIKHVILKAIEEEKNHPNHFVMYHGMKSNLWLIYRILSYIRSSFNNDPIIETKVLRSLERFFDVLISAQKVREAITARVMASDEDFDALTTTMSCNPTLFSNFGINDEETLWFLSANHNFTLPKEFNEIIRALFLDLNIAFDEKIFEKLQDIKKILNRSGAMLQFFIPHKAHHLFYLSQAYGEPATSRDAQIITDNMEGMDKLIKYDKNYFDSKLLVNNVQTRLHLNIAHIHDLKVIDYLADSTISLEYIDGQIANAIDPLLESLGRNSITNTSAYRQPTLLQKVSRELLELSKDDMSPEISESERAVSSNDLIALKKACLNNRALIKDFAVINPGDMNKIKISKDQLEVLIMIEDSYLDINQYENGTLISLLSIFQKHISWFNCVEKKIQTPSERYLFIKDFVFNTFFIKESFKPETMKNLIDFSCAGEIGALGQQSDFIVKFLVDFRDISPETIKNVINISNENNLNIKQRMAILGAAKSGIDINNDTLIQTIKNIATISSNFNYFQSFSDAHFIEKILLRDDREKVLNCLYEDLQSSGLTINFIQAYALCDTIDRTRALLKYFIERDKYRFYKWDFCYNKNIYFISQNINKIDQKYVPYFNPYEENIDSFNQYCELIENVKGGLLPELVVALAHELTLMKSWDHRWLVTLVTECLLKNSDDNHALLLRMLKSKRASESFLSPELLLKAYRNDLTLEQYEVALFIFELHPYLERGSVLMDEILNMCKNIRNGFEKSLIFDDINKVLGFEESFRVVLDNINAIVKKYQ